MSNLAYTHTALTLQAIYFWLLTIFFGMSPPYGLKIWPQGMHQYTAGMRYNLCCKQSILHTIEVSRWTASYFRADADAEKCWSCICALIIIRGSLRTGRAYCSQERHGSFCFSSNDYLHTQCRCTRYHRGPRRRRILSLRSSEKEPGRRRKSWLEVAGMDQGSSRDTPWLW